MKRLNDYFGTKTDFGIVFLRLALGLRLIIGAGPYMIGTKPMTDIIGYFQELNIPAPEIGAYISVYFQGICGVLFIAGYKIRLAALIMIFNFMVAIGYAHLGDTYVKAFPAWIMLAGSCSLLFAGAGRVSLDKS